jgi:hypothetical protein
MWRRSAWALVIAVLYITMKDFFTTTLPITAM